MYQAKVIADSISVQSPCVRLTTLEVTIPRIVLAELNTHRKLSRNSASSRAIPVAKLLEEVEQRPFVPDFWGMNDKGMSPNQQIDDRDTPHAKAAWLEARNAAVAAANKLIGLGVHKQTANRLLEPFVWHKVIVSATDWANFLALRTAPEAQHEIRQTALAIKAAIEASVPRPCLSDDWHMPLLSDAERYQKRHRTFWCMVSAARCARVSYLRHDTFRDSYEGVRDDYALAKRLASAGHYSPFEHVARPLPHDQRKLLSKLLPSGSEDGDAFNISGNYRGWIQLRKMFPLEHDWSQTDDSLDLSGHQRIGSEMEAYLRPDEALEFVRNVPVIIPTDWPFSTLKH